MTPVSVLDLHIKDWTIKVRVIRVLEIKSFVNKYNREGRLQQFELIDKFGTIIQGSCFTAQIERFQEFIKVGNVIKVSKCVVERSNPKFSIVDG